MKMKNVPLCSYECTLPTTYSMDAHYDAYFSCLWSSVVGATSCEGFLVSIVNVLLTSGNARCSFAERSRARN